jgi:cholinesterase
MEQRAHSVLIPQLPPRHPLTDYDFGGSAGGSQFGATGSNSYTSSPSRRAKPPIADCKVQQLGSKHIAKSLQFIWICENDLSAPQRLWAGDLHNARFAGNGSAYVENSVATLLNNGAPYVFVANIYPKHVAPVTAKYLCGTSRECVQTW